MTAAVARLNRRQQRFVAEYLIDLNATQAAVRAGYSARSARAIASENLTKPNILSAIDRELAENPALSRVRIIDELARIAFANILDYVDLETGSIDLTDIERDAAAAIVRYEIDAHTTGRRDGEREFRRTKIRLADKLGALRSLARLLGHLGTQASGDEEREEPEREWNWRDGVRRSTRSSHGSSKGACSNSSGTRSILHRLSPVTTDQGQRPSRGAARQVRADQCLA